MPLDLTPDERRAISFQRAEQRDREQRQHELLGHILGALIASTDLRLDKDDWQQRCDRLIEQAKYISERASQ